MKFLLTAAYLISGFLFLLAILGGGIFRPAVDSISESSLEKAGFKKSYVESADSRIDDLIYKSKQIELQIEKIRNFFSSDKIDESKYAREQNNIVMNAVYAPLIKAANYFFRVLFFMGGLIFLCLGVVMHAVNSSINLRRRVKKLEEIIGAQYG